MSFKDDRQSIRKQSGGKEAQLKAKDERVLQFLNDLHQATIDGSIMLTPELERRLSILSFHDYLAAPLPSSAPNKWDEADQVLLINFVAELKAKGFTIDAAILKARKEFYPLKPTKKYYYSLLSR